MELIATLLVFAFVFYVLTRWGCGARMVHGLAAVGIGAATGSFRLEDTDPVCGMRVEAKSAVLLEHGSRVIRFCSEDCRKRFLSHPDAYP
ncbi:MAG: metal ion permease [Acidobacteriota bacterium]|jgi:YHS domain-containing protein|nr:metal ion permease [Acidobacteriota bacterium]